MEFLKTSLFYLYFLTTFCLIGCQNKKAKPAPDLTSLDLRRGEIALCGGEAFGELSFPISCEYFTRPTFNIAVSLLHSFEYDEAEKGFVKVIDGDAQCAMAYWGVAMSIYHALWKAPDPEGLEKGRKILEVAESIPKSEREQDYLDAIGVYFNEWEKTDHETRARQYEQKMESLYKKYPEDTEAAIFYALALNSTADPTDKNYTNQRKAGKILESIFPSQPNHPGIAHYLIHNYDNPVLAPLALSTAQKYAQIAPASAHAQHMPSHIFTRLGLWEASINTNLNSASSGQCYAESQKMSGHWSKEIHAIAYLVYAYLQQGDNQKAMEQYEYIQTMDTVSPAWDHRAAAYPFAAIPVRMALENKDWEKAANISIHSSNIDWTKFPWQKAILHFGRALGASHTGDIQKAEEELAILQSLQQELVDKKDTYKANQIMIQVKTSQAWIFFAKGNNEEALLLMQEATEMEDRTEKHAVTPGEVIPAKELLGDMLLAMNKPKEALEAYELNLQKAPNRFNSLYGAAIAAQDMGDTKKTKVYFKLLLKLTEHSKSTRPEIGIAKKFDTHLF